MRLTIESMAYGFDSVSHDEEGKAVFVTGGVPGDVVNVSVVSSGKSFSRAVISEVLEPSQSRIKPRCPYSEVCGGCPWSNMTYEAQLAAKRKNVIDTLARIGGLGQERAESVVAPIVASDQEWGYRNKVELATMQGPRGFELGMNARSGKGVVAVDRCLLLAKEYQKLPKAVSGALKYMGNGRELGIERVGIRASSRTKQVEVALWTDPEAFPRNAVAKVLTDAAHPTSIARVLVKGEEAARKISRVERLAGRGNWDEKIHGAIMSVAAPSFFQVNTYGAEQLIDLVLDGLQVSEDDWAVDLYCGAGTFTLPLASRCEGVTAIESYGPAVRDLKRNITARGLDEKIEAIGDDAAYQLEVIEDADVVVVDPPRAGLDPSVIGALSDSDARAIAYVSCDPATLARDIALFEEQGVFSVERATPVDLFPQTFHVETVALMTRADA